MIRDEVLKAIKKHIPKDVPVTLSVPEDSRFGHYATNVAFALSKKESKPPLAIAEHIASAVTGSKPPVISRATAAAPGFVNFFIKPEALQGELNEIAKAKKKYGVSKERKGEKMQVEFVSANPTGPLTLANGRGGFLGDVLANVLEAAGASVEREFYVNDTGNQIFTLGKSLLAAGGFVPDEENLYKGEYVSEWATKHKTDVKKFRGDPMKLGERAAKDFLKLIQRALEKEAHIKFDRYTSEKAIHAKGYAKKALALFKKKGATYESEGAVWLKTTAHGDDKDRVVITKGGFPTYFLADAGHYLETKARGFKAKINILGPDHYGYVARIQAAAKLVGLPKSDVLITQAVRLIRGGEEVKMSKRKGNFVTFEEVVEEVGADAARFFFLSVSPTSHLDFNLDLAKERSKKNPVYYAQYALVRAKGVLGKVQISKSKFQKNSDLSLLNTLDDAALLFQLSRFPEVLADAAATYEVHRLTQYASTLARAFHNFYEKEHVLGEVPALAAARLALVRGSMVIFENLFRILSISAPEKM
ncbi:MAG: arginine--tRNA ligase [Candidatus Brennerbacteria bacterium]|nr:arginine--tRNA ligase [Candidatus Brennerbacteria bacterium]